MGIHLLGLSLSFAFAIGAQDVRPTVLTRVDTIASESSGLLGKPWDIAVIADGRVAVVDYSTPSILVVDPRTRSADTLGRGGGGPGEFRQPWALGVSGDTLWVLDGRSLRLQAFSVAGEYLLGRQVRGGMVPPVHIGVRGELVVGTDGEGGVLARRIGTEGTPSGTLGTAISRYTPVMPMRQMALDIDARRVPAEGRNRVLPLVIPGGDTWLLLETESTVLSFRRDGSLQWSKSVSVPNANRIRDDFFTRNRDLLPRRRFFELRHFADAEVVGAEVWILLNSPETDPAMILVLSSDGRPVRTLEVPGVRGARAMAVDQRSASLYLSVPEDAVLIRVALPGSVVK